MIIVKYASHTINSIQFFYKQVFVNSIIRQNTIFVA